MDCFINDERIAFDHSVSLCHGDIIQLGDNLFFRFVHPSAALRQRDSAVVSKIPQILNPKHFKKLTYQVYELRERLEAQAVSQKLQIDQMQRKAEKERRKTKEAFDNMWEALSAFKKGISVCEFIACNCLDLFDHL